MARSFGFLGLLAWLVIGATVACGAEGPTAVGSSGPPAPGADPAAPSSPLPSGGSVGPVAPPSGTPPSGTGSGSVGPGAPSSPPSAEEQRVFGIVAPQHLAQLDHLVGQYAKGTTPVYRGSFSARDNRGSVEPSIGDDVLSTTDAVASLATAPVPGGGASAETLTVFSPTDHRHVALTQTTTQTGTPQSTTVSMVLDDGVSGGVTASCAGCAPAFAQGPTSIAATDPVATGTWGTGESMTVSVSGSLSRMGAATLVFDDVVHLNQASYSDAQAIQKLAPSGGEMSATLEDELHEPTTVPPGKSFYECHHVTSYAIDWYVTRANLASYGVRNLRIEKAQTCCVTGPDIPCTVNNRTCF
jgi:hypothetical protein